ncbi:hypothetical protein CUV01_14645 [Paracoccus tegillarcae]|uniref:CysZ protein n=1 Tax=Paracoccus tegillarcae TaxID=1529068 RepID=A0A2K9EKA9_9RHOB|nr:hypothetical protein CUV01_14645 [Paracoccus tegillarcae]
MGWRALARGWADLLRPRILNLLLIGVGLTIALFIALQAGVFALVRALTPGQFSLPWIGTVDVGNALSWGSLALFPLMGFFLMGPVAAAFSGLFAERVSDQVEEIHYPKNRGQSIDFMDGLLESVAVVAAMLGVLLLTLLATPFLGPFAPLLFYTANGWLLGREFFQMAARRHLHEPQATALRKANATQITLAGIAIAVLLTIPVLNIAVPVLAAAVFTHLFQYVQSTSGPVLPYPRG